MKIFGLFLFIIWGLPLTHYRSKFRKMVYQTDDWRINFKPVFWKELKGLFTNLYPENKKYIKIKNILFILSHYIFRFVYTLQS